MILRNIAVRHGKWPARMDCRQAVAAPVARPWLRALSTESTTPPAATTTDAKQPPQTLDAHSLLPAYKRRELQAIEAKDALIPDNYRVFRGIQKKTERLGSRLESRYLPNDILQNPPSEATLELLMASQAHMGHNTSLWNPANSRYIYGVREGIHIISLEQTLSHLRRATRVVEEVAYHGGLILFVGTRKHQMEIVVRTAELAGACHLFQKWTPGSITNRDQLLAGSPVQIVDENDRPIPGFEKHLLDRRPLVPDLVVCLNPMENYTLLYECGLASIPTIGIIDTDADPSWVTYAIPGNDDSIRAVSVIASVLGRAGQRGKRRRLKDAEEGLVTWETPAEVARFIQSDAKRKATEIAQPL
ncbi:ribosomal protein S2 [Thozetella sp. PMI_491]|nr:ribosomal protein S2 [Thozetella sp. PMI_491]